jgi:hypothetical protein
MNLRLLLAALTLCVATFIATLVTRSISPAITGLTANTKGEFLLGGQNVGEPLVHAEGVRLWGSWAGSDENTGTLALGPFLAPPVLRFAVSGYPTQEDNRIYIEHVATKAQIPVKLAYDLGSRWTIVEVASPPDWIGQPITLNGSDQARSMGGWLALSEPLYGGRGDGKSEFLETVAGWSIGGLCLGLMWFAALRHVVPKIGLAPHWSSLAAAAIVATCGYGVFWAYFANATLGKILSIGLVLLGLVGTSHRGAFTNQPSADALAAPKIMFAVSLFYLALLHFFPSPADFYSLAANRFRDGLPGDNTLPRNIAHALFKGESLKQSGGDWLSSDRPPLQAGWILLTWPVTAALHLDERTASGVMAVWFQSLWVLGAYGLLRSLGLPRPRASAWLATMALVGFFAQNTLFTWPKLAAGAFACGAFGLWTLSPNARPRLVEYLLGASFAGLAWLAHGGVAFSFLALAPWIGWRMIRGPWRPWAMAASVFVAFAAPWLAYQKYYDPPGDRLLKWHLGGVIAKDNRGAWQTIRESYNAITWREIASHKMSNVQRQIEGTWNWWRDFSPGGAEGRRNDEFFSTGRAFTWSLLGVFALPFAIARGRLRTAWRTHAALTSWTLATLLLWCIAMFSGGQAVIHHGSYAMMIGLFVLLSAWLEMTAPWLIFPVAALHAISFATTWAVPNTVINGSLNWSAVALALGALVGLVRLVVQEHRLYRHQFPWTRDSKPESQ